MKRIHCIILAISLVNTHVALHTAFLQELIEAQEARGIRITTADEVQFENQIKNLTMQLTAAPLTTISQNNVDQASMMLDALYRLFFNPAYIKYSTKTIMNDFFDQLKTWHDTLKKNNIIIPWFKTNEQELKNLLVLALKEICLFGRYTKHKEEHLVTFKLRMQHILTNIMMDSDLTLWKQELITNNQQFFLGSFYSWDVALIKAEFKDSAALIPLFNKLSTTIDVTGEKQAAQRHEQERALEQQQLAQRRKQEADTLRAIVANIEQQISAPDTVSTETLYLNYIRALLDPAYLDLSAKDRKSIDTFNDHFKKLHAAIGNKFIPILSPDGIDTLKLLVAKSLETISSPLAGKTGGVAFKNHIESVLKTIMSINANQTLTENNIKFQWIKPLYTDNQLLSNAMKKKLLDIFNNQHFQRWQASTRNLSLKLLNTTASAGQAPIAIQAPIITEAPLIRIQGPKDQEISEEISETLPMPQRRQQRKAEPQQKPAAKTPTVQRVVPTRPIIVTKETAPTPFTIITPQPTKPTPSRAQLPAQQTQQAPSENIQQIGAALITQSLVAPLSTIKNTLANIAPQQKFNAIKTTDNGLYTPVHAAASLGRSDVLAALLADLTPDERYAIVTMREKDGQTALHLAAAAKSAPTRGFKPANAVKELLHNLNQRQQVDFITMQDKNGITAQNIAQGINKAVAINLKEILQRSRK